MLELGITWPEIEAVTGVTAATIQAQLAYHARREALERQRSQDPEYLRKLEQACPRPTAMPDLAIDEEDKVAELYKPRVPLPESLKKYAGRKAYG